MLLISAATLGLLATMTQTSRLRPRSRYPLFIAAALLTLGLAGLAAAIAWGGPHDIPPLSSINNPFNPYGSRFYSYRNEFVVASSAARCISTTPSCRSRARRTASPSANSASASPPVCA